MTNRLKLHNLLVDLFGSNNVYYQPPESIKLKYPCILYSHDRSDSQFGDNHAYIYKKRYQITVIDPKPDNPVLDKLPLLPQCLFDRHYSSDNLHHYIFNIYF
ncbi:MAG: hypothetical protein WCS17_12020 [Prevotella sp.]